MIIKFNNSIIVNYFLLKRKRNKKKKCSKVKLNVPLFQLTIILNIIQNKISIKIIIYI